MRGFLETLVGGDRSSSMRNLLSLIFFSILQEFKFSEENDRWV